MKPRLSTEQTGTTSFGDPEIVVTVEEPHPKAGFQLLLRSTASIPHMAGRMAETGHTSYLVYPYPDPDQGPHTPWHGAARGASLEDTIEELSAYVERMWQREQVADRINLGPLRDRLDRFCGGLWESPAIDYRAEWRGFLEEVARIDMLMAEEVQP